MRVAIAELKQETNTFVPRPTTLADFDAWHHWRGATSSPECAIPTWRLPGSSTSPSQRIEPVPILATFAMSGGKVTTATYQILLDELLTGLRERGPFDGVLLALHGAMVSDEDDDPDGAIITAVRFRHPRPRSS